MCVYILFIVLGKIYSQSWVAHAYFALPLGEYLCSGGQRIGNQSRDGVLVEVVTENGLLLLARTEIQITPHNSCFGTEVRLIFPFEGDCGRKEIRLRRALSPIPFISKYCLRVIPPVPQQSGY